VRFLFFQAEDGIRDRDVTGVQTCALPIWSSCLPCASMLPSFTGADQIVVVKDGSIEAQGRHEDLLRHCALYADLWQAHMGAKERSEERRVGRDRRERGGAEARSRRKTRET